MKFLSSKQKGARLSRAKYVARDEKMGFLKTLVKLIGDGCIIFGIILTAFGVYGLAGGTGIRFFMGGRLVTPQEGGQITSIVGIVLLFVGIVITYIRSLELRCWWI